MPRKEVSNYGVEPEMWLGTVVAILVITNILSIPIIITIIIILIRAKARVKSGWVQ